MALAERTIGAVVLMAGCSNRMSEGNKLLMGLGDSGVSVAERTIQSIVGAGYQSILIVTGHDADKLRTVLGDVDVQWVHNSRYKDGMGTSIARAFNLEDWDAALIVLGDMPFLSLWQPSSIFVRSALSTQIKSSYRHSTVGVTTGHLSLSIFTNSKSVLEMLVERKALQSHPESVMLVDVGDEAIHWDVDTVEMLNRYVKASQEVMND